MVGSVGAIGHERITAIRDTVNFASRIQSANRRTGTRLLGSQAVYDAAGSRLEIGRRVSVEIAGKTGEHALYEVLGPKSNVPT